MDQRSTKSPKQGFRTILKMQSLLGWSRLKSSGRPRIKHLVSIWVDGANHSLFSIRVWGRIMVEDWLRTVDCWILMRNLINMSARSDVDSRGSSIHLGRCLPIASMTRTLSYPCKYNRRVCKAPPHTLLEQRSGPVGRTQGDHIPC
jgi:hypothetical protein